MWSIYFLCFSFRNGTLDKCKLEVLLPQTMEGSVVLWSYPEAYFLAEYTHLSLEFEIWAPSILWHYRKRKSKSDFATNTKERKKQGALLTVFIMKIHYISIQAKKSLSHLMKMIPFKKLGRLTRLWDIFFLKKELFHIHLQTVNVQ